MSKIKSEQRSIRLGLSTYLSGWTDLTFSEGWDEIDIERPLVNVYIIDGGKDELELGRITSPHRLYSRTVQIDVFMETEDRVRTISEEIMEYLDIETTQIVDPMTSSGIGYLIFPESHTIRADFLAPSFNNPEILRWRGVVRGKFEAYYPNNGNPV